MFEDLPKVLKAMADPNRLKIIQLLSKESLCACKLLEHFNFTQPTLSHHMRVLEEAGITAIDKQGQWHHYSLRSEFGNHFLMEMKQLFLNETNQIKETK